MQNGTRLSPTDDDLLTDLINRIFNFKYTPWFIHILEILLGLDNQFWITLADSLADSPDRYAIYFADMLI